MACWELRKYVETKLHLTCFPLILSFSKNKEVRKPVSLPYFLHNFWRKILLLLYSKNWTNFIVWFPLLSAILGNMCIAIVYKPRCNVMNFKLNLNFLIKLFFLHDKEAVTKTQMSSERKKLLRWNKKHFSSF